MGWLWSLIEDAGDADSVGDWFHMLGDHQFTFAFMFLAAFGVWVLLSKKDKLGIRPKMTQVSAGMEEGWATKHEVKATGLPE